MSTDHYRCCRGSTLFYGLQPKAANSAINS